MSLRDEMYTLYRRYYEATTPAAFQDDLDAKDQVIVARDEQGNLRGFSSLALLPIADRAGRKLRAIFSGDTIVDHRCWGQQALAFAWIRLAGQLERKDPHTPLYWFLIVKGHRTYRYLHAFTHRYYPHWRDPTPSATQTLMHDLAASRFGEHYQRDSGVVRFPRSRGQLKPAWADVGGCTRYRPEVAHFLRRNPGYTHGDELVCLTRLTGANLRPLPRRLFEQGAGR